MVDGCDMRNEGQDFDLLRRTVEQFRQIEPYLLGDYYALTPYSLAKDACMAWQFNRPEMGEGVVQAFVDPYASIKSLGRGEMHGTIHSVPREAFSNNPRNCYYSWMRPDLPTPFRRCNPCEKRFLPDRRSSDPGVVQWFR